MSASEPGIAIVIAQDAPGSSPRINVSFVAIQYDEDSCRFGQESYRSAKVEVIGCFYDQHASPRVDEPVCALS